MNLATLLTTTAARSPDATAVTMDRTELTYAELDDLSARVAGLLSEAGVKAGDRVGLMLGNVVPFPPIYYGILRIGATVVPMNPLLKTREVSYHLGDSGAKAIFASRQFADAACGGADAAGADCVLVDPEGFDTLVGGAEPWRLVADREADDTAVILYTSGTTGRPKGAEIT